MGKEFLGRARIWQYAGDATPLCYGVPMALARRIIVFIVGSLSFVAGMNLSVPSLTTLARYVIYARPMITDAVPMGSAAQASPIFSLALSAFLGLLLAAAGIALIMRYR